MTDPSKIKPSHTQRAAYVYIRQSTPGQVEHNRESTARQYALADRACQLGWAKQQVVIVDEDLGLSGSGTDKRSGFARLTSEVALAHVGIVLGLEVSRLARNNADWYRLLELCGVTDTLIGDNDGVYHPALFNDRLLLGLKGTMSEAELHIIRARLDGGIRNKAARGELRRGLPVGLVWGEQDGEVLFHPDAAVTGAIRRVFERFAELGSARRVWLWFRSEGLSFPLQTTPAGMPGPIRWVTPTYHALHQVLTNPVYAGAYTYGKTRHERYVDEQGAVRKRTRHLPMEQWAVLIRDHHPGFIDWATFEANQSRLDSNTKPMPHQAGGAVREGSALLQGIVSCGHCGRRLHVHYRGRNSTPGYHCCGKDLVNGRGVYCLNVGGTVIEQAVADAFLQAITPAAIEAMRLSVEQLQANHDAALSQWRLEVERTRYEAERAERRYRAVEPENRLVARGLESEWENRLRDLASAEMELRRREQQRPRALSSEQLQRIQMIGSDIRQVWAAPTTTERDRKELVRTLLEEVILNLKRAEGHAHLTLCWRGGAFTMLDVPVPKFKPMGPRTDEETLSLLPRLATLYPDEVIAGIFNRQGRKTATGERFTANPSQRLNQIPILIAEHLNLAETPQDSGFPPLYSEHFHASQESPPAPSMLALSLKTLRQDVVRNEDRLRPVDPGEHTRRLNEYNFDPVKVSSREQPLDVRARDKSAPRGYEGQNGMTQAGEYSKGACETKKTAARCAWRLISVLVVAAIEFVLERDRYDLPAIRNQRVHFTGNNPGT